MFLVLLASLVAAVAGEHFAVLVAGSNGWINQRHQSDCCHAFHLLTKNGVPAENIIMMYYDDVAYSSYNPFPGQLFNKPGNDSIDVYKNCQSDYVGDDVTVENFLAVITGDAESATGPVLRSGSEDYVFIAFYDHGGQGVSCFPNGRLLYAEDLINALGAMRDQQMYRKMVIYWESCESGSMFEELLPNDWNIYVSTASDAYEDSWATYCPPFNDTVRGKHIGSCLGDAFSVAWMEDSELPSAMKEALEKQYVNVAERVNSSHVSQYGDLHWTVDPVGAFLANLSISPKAKPYSRSSSLSSSSSSSSTTMWNSRDATLRWMENERDQFAHRKMIWEAVYMQQQYKTEIKRRQRIDQKIHMLTFNILKHLNITHLTTIDLLFGISTGASYYSCGDRFGICRNVFDMIEGYCLGKWDEYTLVYAKTARNIAQLFTPHSLPLANHLFQSCLFH